MTDKFRTYKKEDKIKEAQELLLKEQQKKMQELTMKLKKFLDDNNMELNINYQIGVIPKRK